MMIHTDNKVIRTITSKYAEDFIKNEEQDVINKTKRGVTELSNKCRDNINIP